MDRDTVEFLRTQDQLNKETLDCIKGILGTLQSVSMRLTALEDKMDKIAKEGEHNAIRRHF